LDKVAHRKKVKVVQDDIKAFAFFSHDFNLSLFASLDLVASKFKQLHQDELSQGDSLFTQILASGGKCYFGRLITLIHIKTGCPYSKLAQ
ncbi:hypothetical protein, partial [Salmonella enterica]|uniref:hypothetical protein n=2 Tax=Gammaproteobacteria TaxID=1236 RepID=UPI003075AF9B